MTRMQSKVKKIQPLPASFLYITTGLCSGGGGLNVGGLCCLGRSAIGWLLIGCCWNTLSDGGDMLNTGGGED